MKVYEFSEDDKFINTFKTHPEFNHFAVSGNLIKTTSTATDYETRKQYRLSIKVTDKDGLTDTADATINVLNVNACVLPIFCLLC